MTTTVPPSPQVSDPLATDPLDPARLEASSQRIFGAYVDAALVLMIDLADRTGMLDGLVDGPGTSDEVAARTGLQERYVRECLGALVTGGLVGYHPADRRYHLSPEHAACLTGGGATNLAPLSRIPTLLAQHLDEGARVVREGGGIPYERFRPEFTTVMDGLSRPMFDHHLVDALLPLDPGLTDRLTRGIRVADIGCGTGHSTVVLAEAFPASTFVGYDLADDALEVGRAEAHTAGLDNVTFVRRDVRDLPDDPPWDLVVAFDVVHDQADPAGVLQRVHDCLVPGGTFLTMDIRASSNLEDNVDDPRAPLLYAVSTLHCMTVSLAQGGVGLGTVWGEQVARRMLAEAGFVDLAVHEVPDDPLNQIYLCRAAGGA